MHKDKDQSAESSTHGQSARNTASVVPLIERWRQADPGLS